MFKHPVYAEDLKELVDLYCREEQEGPNYMFSRLVTNPDFAVQYNPRENLLLIVRQGFYIPQLQVVVARRPSNGYAPQ